MFAQNITLSFFMTPISFITIGSELLKGTIINTNAARAGQMLREAGYALSRVVTIADDRAAIAAAVREELAHSPVVLMSGGLGPTKDDITKYTLGEIFGAQHWSMHPPTLAHLEQRYRNRGRALNDLTRQQALVPDVCTVLPNVMGTAPGLLFRQDDRFLAAMPGVPFEMLHLLKHEVIPLLQRERADEAFVYEWVRISGVSESLAAQRIEAIEGGFPPGVDLAFLPRADGLWLEVSTRRPKAEAPAAEAAVIQAADQLFSLFAQEAYTRTPTDLAQLVQETCREKGLTLAVAESLTGGAVAAQLVSVAGASHFFKGSVTAYFTEVKTQVLQVPTNLIEAHGVVSEPVARRMAEGVRDLLQADVGLASTGQAEAQGDRRAEAWLAYADRHGSEAMHGNFIYNRSVNIERAANLLLLLALRKVQARF